MVMTVECPSCASTFPVDPDKVPEGGVNARCTSCSEVFRVERPSEPEVEATWEAPAAPAAEEAALPGEPPATQADTESLVEPQEAEPDTGDDWDVGAELAEPTDADTDFGAGSLSDLDPPAGTEEDAEASEPGAQADWEAWQGSGGDEEPDTSGDDDALEASTPLTMDAGDDDAWGTDTGAGIHTGTDEVEPAAEAEADDWVFETEDDPMGSGLDDEEEAAEGVADDSFFMAGTAPAETDTEDGADLDADGPSFDIQPGGLELEGDDEAADDAAVAEPEAEAPAEEAAPVQGFSFGRRDPADKARRLARVLVSDMIMYNPERHQRALANGTLKDDFEDEIAKSWKEYVEQVGVEMAESTTYWTDALNDILAKGDPVF